jgi:hypothetical protein
MSFNFAVMNINRIMIHEIFVRNDNREVVPPRCNNILTQLDANGLNVLQKRIINALGSDSHSVEMEVSDVTAHSTFELITKMINDDGSNFIEHSKLLANKLTASQTTRNIPGGILVVFDGTIGGAGQKYLGVIKAEMHEGFTIDKDDTSLLLKYLSDLLLTPQQKLYKIGIFIEASQTETTNNARLASDFKVFIYDQNISGQQVNEAATYFYHSFLGCKLCANNKKLTQDFYTLTKEFIDGFIEDDEKKLDLNYALYTYLKTSQSNTVSIGDFVDQFLPNENKDSYRNYMETKEFPTNAIPKDIALLAIKLSRRKIRFTSEVSILAPSQNFKDLVKIISSEEDKTTIEVKGKIKEQR